MVYKVCGDLKSPKSKYRPIDSLFSSKPKTRTRRMPTLARRSAQPSEASTSVTSRLTLIRSPKKIVIVKNGDPTFRQV